MDENICVTFVVDLEYNLTLNKLKKSNSIDGKISIFIDRCIIDEVKYKDSLRATFIHCKKIKIDNVPLSKRLYITYEVDLYNANHFVYLVQKNISTIFKIAKKSRQFEIIGTKLMNDELRYDYYKDYWNSFLFLSDSPRCNI